MLTGRGDRARETTFIYFRSFKLSAASSAALGRREKKERSEAQMANDWAGTGELGMGNNAQDSVAQSQMGKILIASFIRLYGLMLDLLIL